MVIHVRNEKKTILNFPMVTALKLSCPTCLNIEQFRKERKNFKKKQVHNRERLRIFPPEKVEKFIGICFFKKF
ncbi:hypothetical protein BpHYR1_035749 [Brachionus plicatilis]|uniref:Uncharacterized protein n=1 Tax=Brachionus plicatilis TaxID=10195 RepID=A0A3M7SSS4_BRAPC|nr:hypothetical protein BpHYR1_035749 [Brachionus plicatilis]